MPRIHGTQDDVIRAFMRCQEYPCEASNIYHHGDTLYSYGRHFWLSIRHESKVTGTTYLLNGDYYSSTTRNHQGMVQQHAPGDALTVSGAALKAAGIDPRRMVIKDREKDLNTNFNTGIKLAEVSDGMTGVGEAGFTWSEYKEAVTKAGQDFIKDMPAGATLFSHTIENPENREQSVTLPNYYHRPASAVLVRKREKAQRYIREPGEPYGTHEDYWKPAAYFVLGMDDNQYFISELPGRPQTVAAAFEALKPRIVKDAETAGKEIERQGEWFFIKEIDQGKEARALYRQMGMNFNLTNQSNDRGASHTATRGAPALALKFQNNHENFKASTLLVSGQIRHSTHEHPMLGLSYVKQPEIWQAARNTAKNSWSMGGNVD